MLLRCGREANSEGRYRKPACLMDSLENCGLSFCPGVQSAPTATAPGSGSPARVGWSSSTPWVKD